MAPLLLTILGGTQAAAVNQDGSVNDALAPAAGGSVVSLFLTGCGQTAPPWRAASPRAPPGAFSRCHSP